MTISQIQTFDPTQLDESGVQQGLFSSMLSGKCGTLYLINESLVTLLLTNATDEVVGILPATWAQPFVVQSPTPTMKWVAIANQNATNDYTLKEVQGMAYSQGEDTSKLYTGPLIRQASLGNTANTNATVGTLNNTQSAPGTQIILITPTDASQPTFSLDNSGNLIVRSDNAGALVALLQLIAGATPSVELGSTTVATNVHGVMNMLNKLIFHNNEAIWWLDTGGTPRLAFGMAGGNTNTLVIRAIAGNGSQAIELQDASGNTQLQIKDTAPQVSAANELAYASLSCTATGTSYAGTQGTVTVIQEAVGTLKRLWLIFNNYEPNPDSGQVIPVPTPFTLGGLLQSGEIGSVSGSNTELIFKSGATTQAVKIYTALSTGGGSQTEENYLSQLSFGELMAPFDSITITGQSGKIHTGFVKVEGQ